MIRSFASGLSACLCLGMVAAAESSPKSGRSITKQYLVIWLGSSRSQPPTQMSITTAGTKATATLGLQFLGPLKLRGEVFHAAMELWEVENSRVGSRRYDVSLGRTSSRTWRAAMSAERAVTFDLEELLSSGERCAVRGFNGCWDSIERDRAPRVLLEMGQRGRTVDGQLRLPSNGMPEQYSGNLTFTGQVRGSSATIRFNGGSGTLQRVGKRMVSVHGGETGVD